ncbi:MAG: dockerin type I repeat-containing protein [Oscillospiraceae bacterium]|nr:dockerin type I repeat-containing protein [Oscillospiraceae bacterium]
MKNLNLRKMTAFAAALALATQSGIVLNAEESTENEPIDTVTANAENDKKTTESEEKADKSDPVALCLLHNYYADTNGDGVLSEAELYKIEDAELDGKYFSEPLTSLGVLKKTHVSRLVIKNMKNFDLELLKDLKSLKVLEFNGNTSVKNIEVLGALNLNLIRVDTSDSEDCIKSEDVYPYIKCEDITVSKGEIKALRSTPDFDPGYGYEKCTLFKFEDWNSALLIEDEWASTAPFDPVTSTAVLQDRAFVYGLAEGETTYTLHDRQGYTIGKAKVTVTAADEPNDPVLVKTAAKPLKVLNTESYEHAHSAYILYDNGSLYYFKDGSLKEYQKNIKDAAINDHDIYALSEEGVLYINGKSVNNKSEYTVESANKSLDFFLCSDGCIRRISDGKAETVLKNIKTMDENFGGNHVICGIVQDEQDVTSIVYRNPENQYVKYPLAEKFKAVRISFKNPVLNGGLYYVFTDDSKIYEISAVFPVRDVAGFTLSDTIPSATVKLFAENVKDMYGSDYITSDGNEYSTHGGEGNYDEEYILLNEMIEYGNIRIKTHDLTDLKKNKLGKVTSYDVGGIEPYFSVRDNDGTERYDFVKNAKPLTHVKINYGMYSHGKDRCMLIQRDDDTLWNYVLETGELSRIDEAINGSEVLTGTDPEPEKTEPKEPSENENKDAEPKEGTPDKKEGSENVSGDVSGDGRVDVTDLTMISLALLGDTNLTEAQSQVADINHNGKVDLSDLATMRQFLSKKIEKL